MLVCFPEPEEYSAYLALDLEIGGSRSAITSHMRQVGGVFDPERRKWHTARVKKNLSWIETTTEADVERGLGGLSSCG